MATVSGSKCKICKLNKCLLSKTRRCISVKLLATCVCPLKCSCPNPRSVLSQAAHGSSSSGILHRGAFQPAQQTLLKGFAPSTAPQELKLFLSSKQHLKAFFNFCGLFLWWFFFFPSVKHKQSFPYFCTSALRNQTPEEFLKHVTILYFF